MTALEPRDADVSPRTEDTVEALGTAVAAAPDGVLGRTYRALSIGIVSVVFLIAFEATAVGTAMPVAARELHGIPLYAFAFSAYFTTSLFAMVLSGQWADRRGPLAPLAAGISAFGAGLLLSGTAGTMWMFIAGRAVQGLGGGLVIVALYVVISRAYPEHLRPSILAAFAASWVIPSVVGPLASGSVTEHLGWRWVFVGIPVLVVFPLALALPAIRRTASGPADPSAPAVPYDHAAHRARAGHLAGCRSAPVRRAGAGLVLPAARCRRCGPAGPRGARSAAPGHRARGARAARGGAAARGGGRIVHRRRVVRPADAGHPARDVPDDGRTLARHAAAGRGRWARTYSPGRARKRIASG